MQNYRSNTSPRAEDCERGETQTFSGSDCTIPQVRPLDYKSLASYPNFIRLAEDAIYPARITVCQSRAGLWLSNHIVSMGIV